MQTSQPINVCKLCFRNIRLHTIAYQRFVFGTEECKLSHSEPGQDYSLFPRLISSSPFHVYSGTRLVPRLLFQFYAVCQNKNVPSSTCGTVQLAAWYFKLAIFLLFSFKARGLCELVQIGTLASNVKSDDSRHKQYTLGRVVFGSKNKQGFGKVYSHESIFIWPALHYFEKKMFKTFWNAFWTWSRNSQNYNVKGAWEAHS